MAGKLRRKEHGYFRAEGWHGEVSDGATLQCCHCGAHFAVRPGSGQRRGFCCSCSAVTCGRPMCDACVPMLQQIENVEAGRDRFFRPIRAHVPVDPLAGVPKAHLDGGILLGGGLADPE